jgi:DNA invertase Pin-like site-specific DNA recombinase
MEQAISYLRVSGKGQLDGDGFERQRQAIQRFAESTGYQIVDEFCEPVSGTTDIEERPALMGALERVATNGVRVVIVESAHRLARELMIQESIIKQFIDVGARLLTAEGYELTDESDPTRTAMRQMLGVFAQWEKRCLVLKLRAARKRLRQRTGRCEGRKPFGARDGEAQILERARRLRETGATFAAIATHLHADGSRNRNGKPWSAAGVYHMLTRSSAAG